MITLQVHFIRFIGLELDLRELIDTRETLLTNFDLSNLIMAP